MQPPLFLIYNVHRKKAPRYLWGSPVFCVFSFFLLSNVLFPCSWKGPHSITCATRAALFTFCYCRPPFHMERSLTSNHGNTEKTSSKRTHRKDLQKAPSGRGQNTGIDNLCKTSRCFPKGRALKVELKGEPNNIFGHPKSPTIQKTSTRKNDAEQDK